MAALAALLVACGKQGDPRPRPRPVPQAAKDLTVRQRGGDVLLEFSYPAATVAGLPLERLTAVIVYEAESPTLGDGKLPTLREAELEAMAKPVQELVGPALDEAVVGGKIAVQRTLPAEALGGAAGRIYAVRTKGPGGEVSPFSNTAGVKPRALPPSPGDLDAAAQGDGILIRWSAPAGTTPRVAPPPATPAPTPPAPATTPPSTPATPAPSAPATPAPTPPTAAPTPATPAATAAAPPAPATPGLLPIAGYVVLRREATNPRWGAPLAIVSPTTLEHLDRTARYGTRYVYTVLTLLETDPPVESAPQSAREIDYRDLFAPTPPTELRALLVGDAVRLVWEPSPEADLAGYWIERAEVGAAFRRVNAQLVTGTDHTDPLPPGGGPLRYRLVAVDAAGNAALPTEAVVVDRP